jgi:hypothetical protein
LNHSRSADRAEQLFEISSQRERDISTLVDDTELVSGGLPLQMKQPLLIASLQQFMNKGGCIEPDR